jgi:hypothetical protein
MQRRHDRRRGSLALHRRVRDHDPGDWTTTSDDRHHVVQCRAVGARDDRDARRQHRERALSFDGEEAFRLELPVDLFERFPPEAVS